MNGMEFNSVSTSKPIWYHRESRLENKMWRISAYATPEHEDGAIIDRPELGGPERAPVWRSVPSSSGLIEIQIAPEEAVNAPALWFVNVDEPAAEPRATNLVAFATDHFPAGTIVTKYAFAPLRLPSSEQVGAIRWYPQLAVVHQIFVAESWRRKRAGSGIIYAASAFHQSMGWPGALHSDGRRTDLGEQFVAAQRYPQRFAARTDAMPSMDS